MIFKIPAPFSIKVACNTQPIKTDLNKKSFPKQKTIQNFTIDAPRV